MKLSHWLALPAFAVALCISGCGPDTGTTVIEAPVQSEQEVADADAAYEEAYNQGAQSYESQQ